MYVLFSHSTTLCLSNQAIMAKMVVDKQRRGIMRNARKSAIGKTAALTERPSRMRRNASTFQGQRAAHGNTATFTATEAKNGFGRVFEKAIQGYMVIITKHDAPKAVLMSIDEFNSLSRVPESKIDTLTAQFDSLLAGMQGPRARRAMDDAFHAGSKQLGRAAVAAARKRD